MYSRFLHIQSLSRLHSLIPNPFTPQKILEFSIPIHRYHQISSPALQNPPANTCTDHEALKIQTLLKIHSNKPIQEVSLLLDDCNLSLSQDLALNVLKRHRSDWKPAYTFFRWLSNTRNSIAFSPDTFIHNEILDILGRSKHFDELHQVLDEMPKRNNLINERTFGIVMNRLAAAHKHVERAELLFRSKKHEFRDDIKTWNIILNGWCVLRSLPDAKRFWKDIVASGPRPDKFTYSIFINSLTKSGKTTTSTELLRKMWENSLDPDVTICNNVIDGLCFKKRIPEALRIFDEMSEKRGCSPNVATYNTLIKHLCKIRRMDKVGELLSEMEKTKMPNLLTYGYLLKATKKIEEVDEILERMRRSGCELDGDSYNLVLRLFMEWGDENRVRCVWNEMKRFGLGPDKRSYTIVIHGLYDKGRIREGLEYFDEMVEKGMVPEPRTELLADDMKLKLRNK
ncbi:putative pentatricopeptide repeat-containing protein at3g15200 [Phtheirospermum japonicum]|uniref:Putative pentatricopeptide repeat-containing protein at3g15200 n=1 Tax=Phtheirospermum japonicum TaxID=374723 RepID=A0A830AZH9_9LAMI|nr:putative pentatricopeptide repeat-containing protein at3g15200 [Phtheirospermum japonicum]